MTAVLRLIKYVVRSPARVILFPVSFSCLVENRGKEKEIMSELAWAAKNGDLDALKNIVGNNVIC